MKSRLSATYMPHEFAFLCVRRIVFIAYEPRDVAAPVTHLKQSSLEACGKALPPISPSF